MLGPWQAAFQRIEQHRLTRPAGRHHYPDALSTAQSGTLEANWEIRVCDASVQGGTQGVHKECLAA
ncbi:hypothetical protein GCM10008957_33050 [Deinococcus ruber]|uniref:Uncharacterized protein n=1 Tax=Deinococcus ruber TaxID=1848197 RepID=A0A918CEW8_9DEIO|nr:hypothetical protein GCM10008957_33050 [Deinococcus ruber]